MIVCECVWLIFCDVSKRLSAELLGRIKVLKRLNESQATHTDIRRKQIEKRRNILILNEKSSIRLQIYLFLFV